MAKVIERKWRSGPRRAKRCAYGYSLMVNGKQERKYCATWTREEAEKALAARLLGLTPAPGAEAPPTGITLGQAQERYLATKEAERKQTKDDRHHLKRLVPFFGGPRSEERRVG